MKDNVTQIANAKRAEAKANALHPMSKAERQKGLGGVTLASPKGWEGASGGAAKADPTPEPSPTSTPAPAEAEKKAKVVRKRSAHHIAWVAEKDPDLGAKIVVLAANNPKKRGAAPRFALYRSGMTVQEYIDAQIKSNLKGTGKALALADIRWDATAGFISVG